MTESGHSLATEFARISQQLAAEPAGEETLQRVADLAVQTVPGCDYCGISMRLGDGRVETPASTDPLVERADALQYELAEGPCLDAIWVDDTYVIDNMLVEQRWPRWAPKAAELGMRSILSVRLATPRDLVGGLNLYSADVDAFDEDAVVTAHIYAAHASAAIAATNEVEHLRTAMQSRHLIGVAQGLLMQRYALTEDAAFQVLSRHSQNSNVRLRDVAAELVAEFKRSGRLL
jgi:transcriptional regulator with GAF, ATPase, and Fis domain